MFVTADDFCDVFRPHARSAEILRPVAMVAKPCSVELLEEFAAQMVPYGALREVTTDAAHAHAWAARQGALRLAQATYSSRASNRLFRKPVAA